ncbi:hypothetical protein Dimus_033720 [Dionaea muscipula]
MKAPSNDDEGYKLNRPTRTRAGHAKPRLVTAMEAGADSVRNTRVPDLREGTGERLIDLQDVQCGGVERISKATWSPASGVTAFAQ